MIDAGLKKGCMQPCIPADGEISITKFDVLKNAALKNVQVTRTLSDHHEGNLKCVRF